MKYLLNIFAVLIFTTTIGLAQNPGTVKTSYTRQQGPWAKNQVFHNTSHGTKAATGDDYTRKGPKAKNSKPAKGNHFTVKTEMNTLKGPFLKNKKF